MRNYLKEFFSVERRTKYFVHILVFLLITSVAVFCLLIIGEQSLSRKKGGLKETPNAFKNLNLEARAAIVWDVINSRELFSKNPDESLPLASLTKVLTAIVASEKLGNNQKIEITREDLAAAGDSHLIVGDIWRARDLIDFTLLTSSNDGALALAAAVKSGSDFIKEMNEAASSIGLSNSRFSNEHGLDETGSQNGACGSARDTVTLFEYALKNHPDILEATRYKNLAFTSAEGDYFAENTNVLVDKIPNLIASKTGFTDLAGGNLVIVFDAGLNRPIIISVLGSSEEGRFSDVSKLVEATIRQLPNL